MKKLLNFVFLAGIFLNCALAQGMEEENNGGSDQIDKIESSSPSYTQAAFKLIATGLNRLVATTGKYSDPYSYITSNDSKTILTLATEKFRNAKTIEDVIVLHKYIAMKEEPARMTGNLIRKVTDREYAFNKALDELALATNQERDPIKKTGRIVTLKTFIDYGEMHVRPAIKAKEGMYMRVFGIELPNTALQVNNNILEENFKEKDEKN